VPAGATSGGGGVAAMDAACSNREAAAAAAAKGGRSLRLPSHEPPTWTSAFLRRPTDGAWPSPPTPQSPWLAAQGGGDVAWAMATAAASQRQRRQRRGAGGGRRCGGGRGRGGGRCHPLLATGNVASNERCRRPEAAGVVTVGTKSGGEGVGVGAWRNRDVLTGCDAVAAFRPLPARAPDPPPLRLPSRLMHPPSFPHSPHLHTPREHRGVSAGTAAHRRRWRRHVIADRRRARWPCQHRTAGGPLAVGPPRSRRHRHRAGLLHPVPRNLRLHVGSRGRRATGRPHKCCRRQRQRCRYPPIGGWGGRQGGEGRRDASVAGSLPVRLATRPASRHVSPRFAHRRAAPPRNRRARGGQRFPRRHGERWHHDVPAGAPPAPLSSPTQLRSSVAPVSRVEVFYGDAVSVAAAGSGSMVAAGGSSADGDAGLLPAGRRSSHVPPPEALWDAATHCAG